MKLIVAIIGPTASGKTTFAIELAKRIGGEIIGMDSTTVYRGFDVGSSKPSKAEREMVPHHLIDVLDPDENFSAGRFRDLAEAAISDIQSRNKIPLLVGGTYFYLRALQHGMYPLPEIPSEITESIEREFFEEDQVNTTKMHAALASIDPVAAKNIHPNDKYRMVRALSIFRATKQLPSSLQPTPVSEQSKDRYWLKYAIGISRHTLGQAIANRTGQMLEQGLVNETRAIAEKYPNAKALHSIGYHEAMEFLNRRLTEKQLRVEIIEKTRQLAKRQVNWLRSDPEVRYIDFRDLDRTELEIKNLSFVFEKGAACAQ